MTLPETMAAVEISAPGGPDALRPVRVPTPLAGPGEVLIRVAAAGVNGPDLGQRRGTYAPPPGASPLPGLEVSGEIAALGDAAGSWNVGDRVVALTNGGGYAEYVTVPAGQVLPAPAGWPLTDAASLPETFFTVMQTMVMRAGIEPGMNVLVHGAAGGLGAAAIQIAAVLGARPIAVVSSEEKARYCCGLGAAKVIIHTREDFVARTRELTDGKGADRILEMAGGETLASDIEAAARGAHIVVVASLAGGISQISAGKLVTKHLAISGSTLRPQSAETKAAIARRLREEIWPAIEGGRITPPRIQTFALEEARRAHAAMEQRGHFGKILLLTTFGRSRD